MGAPDLAPNYLYRPMQQQRIVYALLFLLAIALLIWLWKRDDPRDSEQATSAVQDAPISEASPPPGNGNRQSGERLALSRDLMEKANRPIEFFGKIVDQHNDPIADVKVTLRIRITKEVSPNLIQDVFDNQVVYTGEDGRFALTGAKGALLGIGALEKSGYEPSEKGLRKTYWYWRDPSQVFQPDPENPEIFRMWKKSGAEKLVVQCKMTRIPYDGSVVTFDLLTGRKAATGGDFRVRLVRDPLDIHWGQRNFEWTLTIEPVDGGIMPTDHEQMYQAPSDGYRPNLIVHMPADGKEWTDTKSIKFYLKSRGGEHYSRVEVGVMVGSEKPTTGLTFSSFLNPSGLRNLEFDPLQNVKPAARPTSDSPQPRSEAN